MYAVIETGGKQYKVEEGATITVEKLPEAEGEDVTFDRVLFVRNDDELEIGQPLVDGATVRGTVLAQEKDDKKIVLRFKRKNRYRVKRGHRQPITRVQINSIDL